MQHLEKHAVNELPLTLKQLSEQLLDNVQVMKLLGISKRTLQTLRSNGTLPFTKLGKICYYQLSDIQLMLAQHRRGN